MSPYLATLVYMVGIAGLFYLDRESSVRVSKAVWLPVAYLWILCSRPLSVWLGMGGASGGDAQLDGSPVDAIFFGILLIAAIAVLIHRGRRTVTFLSSNLPILIYFGYCLMSVIWSDYSGVAFKRWTKAIGDLAMVLIVVTDGKPRAALSRLFARTGFVLLPLSLLLIKYFPYMGRGWDAWSGAQFNTGLTLNKNTLGVVTFVLLLGAVWRVLSILQSEDGAVPNRGRHLIAQLTLIAIGIYILVVANSVTSDVCFVLGAGLMLAMSLRFMRRHTMAVHALVLFLLVISSTVMLGGGGSVFQALGRNSTLTGRTDIWAAVIPMAQNPVIGSGFESFWLNPVSRKMNGLFFYELNEAHNGYIEMYLELGWVGLCLIALILIDGYRRAVRASRRSAALGALLVAYILCAAIYDITEAGFRMLGPMWIFLLLAVVEASTIAAGVEASYPLQVSRQSDTELPATDALAAR